MSKSHQIFGLTTCLTTYKKISFYTNRGVAQLGRALASGLNHRSRLRIFEKSRKPLKTLTFSALPNVEKSLNLRSDHMFDHLQKNLIFLPFRGVAKVVSRIVRDDEIAGSSPVTSTKKQPKTSYFYLFSAVFLYIFHKIGCFQLTTCLPIFCFLGDFPLLFLNPFENPFSLLSAMQFLRADRSFSASPRFFIIPTNWNLIICKNILAQILPLEFLSSSP